MISLADFRKKMTKEVSRTKEIKSIQVKGHSIDDALRQASLELGIPVSRLEYEILDAGGQKFLGIRRRPCLLIVYRAVKSSLESGDALPEDPQGLGDYLAESIPEVKNLNGKYSLRLAPDGAWIKITPPTDNGTPVTLESVIKAMQDRGVTSIDKETAAKAVKRGDRMWILAGKFEYNVMNDAKLSLEVMAGEMEAYLLITPPGPGGADVTADDMKNYLDRKGIVHGIQEEVLLAFEEAPVFDSQFLAAEGTPPRHGASARVEYLFETAFDRVHIVERKDGSVDYKELNRYQNVVKGQPLARKIPPEQGKEGRTLFGRYVPAMNGSDLEIGLGKNVGITDNGATVVAAADGHVMLKRGKITVEKVIIIPGNVDAGQGNVNALGSVEILGNVEDGFSVSAQGNIEVAGYVGWANLEAGGDIIVSRGINGGEGEGFGHIHAGGTLWSSFVTNAEVTAGEFVIVGSGIVNSQVVAQRKVLCKGGRGRAKIVGGHIWATEEINAVTLGSSGGTETILEVGYNPIVKEEVAEYEREWTALEESRGDVELNLRSLQQQLKSLKKEIPPSKKKLFHYLKKKHKDILAKLKDLEEKLIPKKEYLESTHSHGRISASRQILAGVKIKIRDVEYRVTHSYETPCSFILDGDFIRTAKYQDIKEDLTREPKS